MTPQAGHLRLIDTSTGELHDGGCPECSVKDDTIAGLNRKMNGMAAEITALRRDRAREALENPLWLEGRALFDFYCEMTGKPGKPRKLTWNYERFEMVRPFLEKYDAQLCARAIIGRVHDHHTDRRANGSLRHYYEWDRVFGTAGKRGAAENFEESCKRVPDGWRERLPARFTTGVAA